MAMDEDRYYVPVKPDSLADEQLREVLQLLLDHLGLEIVRWPTEPALRLRPAAKAAT